MRVVHLLQILKQKTCSFYNCLLVFYVRYVYRKIINFYSEPYNEGTFLCCYQYLHDSTEFVIGKSLSLFFPWLNNLCIKIMFADF